MKVVSKIINKTQLNSYQNPVLAYILLSLLLVSLFILLTACDERNTTSSTALSTTALNAVSIKSLPVTSEATKAAAPTAIALPIQPTTLPTAPTGQNGSLTTFSETPTATGEPAQPIIRFSPEVARLGETVEISGNGYPANTKLNIQLATADFRTVQTFATALTDETGSFKTTLNLDPQAQNSSLTPGKLEIAVTTLDNRVGASAPLALQPAANTSSEEACLNLVREFFSTLKRDTQSAQVYLTTDLRSKITSGKANLSGVLGLQNVPLRVDIVKVEGSKNSYQATMFLSDGTQKQAVLDVTTDVSGALRIAAIRAK